MISENYISSQIKHSFFFHFLVNWVFWSFPKRYIFEWKEGLGSRNVDQSVWRNKNCFLIAASVHWTSILYHNFFHHSIFTSKLFWIKYILRWFLVEIFRRNQSERRESFSHLRISMHSILYVASVYVNKFPIARSFCGFLVLISVTICTCLPPYCGFYTLYSLSRRP